MGLEAGKVVGNYRILKKLGSGGMGAVFLAEHPLIGKNVALKVIHKDLAVQQDVVTRFLNEARAVSAIGNEHIVEVHDFGNTKDGAPFFIMEFLDGRTLAQEMRGNQPLPADRALHIGAQIASGLSAAHDKSIIHRDLKPDNIMLIHKLGNPDFVKILDFGLAKMLEGGQQLTAAGVVLGTPEYMSPEIAESKGIDGRSDIYSFGVLLFQMVTGQLPFTAPNMGAMLVQHVCNTPPAPRSLKGDIPPAVEQIILRCLAKAPEDRFQTMHELHAALMDPDGYMRGSPPMVRSEGRTSNAAPAVARRPTTAHANTMAIATPPGFTRNNKGRRMAILAAIAVLAAGGGSAAALMQEKPEGSAAAASGGAAATAAGEGDKADASGEASAPTAAAKAVEDDGAPQPEEPTLTKVKLISTPDGATIFAPDNSALGKTPMVAELEPGVELVLSFELEGYKSLEHTFIPTHGEDVEVTLEAKARAVKTGSGAGNKVRNKPPRGTKKNNVGDNTLAPSF